MKKLIFVPIMAVILAAVASACANLAASDAESYSAPTIYVTVRDGANPGEYRAAVSAANNPGVAGYNLALSFDNSLLTPVSIEEGDAFASGVVFSSNLVGAPEDKIADMNTVTTIWANSGDDTSTGELYSVTFRAASEASGQSELNLTSRGIGNAAEEPVDFALQGAEIDFDGNVNTGTRSRTGILILLLPIAAVSIWLLLRSGRWRKWPDFCYTKLRRLKNEITRCRQSF